LQAPVLVTRAGLAGEERRHLRRALGQMPDGLVCIRMAFRMMMAAGIAVSCPIAHAQQAARPLPLEALLSASTLFPVGPAASVSPDGELIAYTVIDNRRRPSEGDVGQAYRTGVPLQALGSEIWVSASNGKDSRKLTDHGGNSWGPTWSPDGSKMAFLSDAGDGQAHLWIWERASASMRQVGDVRILATQAFPLRRLEWTADSRYALVVTYPEGLPADAYARLITGDRRPPNMSTDTGVTATVFTADPTVKGSISGTEQVSLDKWLGDIALVDVKTGALQRISRGMRICNYALSPDRRLLAWAAVKRSERPGSQQLLMDLFVSRLETGQLRRLVADAPLASDPELLFSWSPTNRMIAYRSYGPEARDQVFVIGLENGSPHLVADGVASHRPLREPGPLWDVGGHHIFFIRAGELWRTGIDGDSAKRFAAVHNRRLETIEASSGQLWSPGGGHRSIAFTFDPVTKRMGFALIDLTSGATRLLFEEDKWYGGYLTTPAVAVNGKVVVYVAESASDPPNLWLLQGDGPTRPRQVSRLNRDLSEFSGGTARLIEWRGLDGDKLRGALIYPAEYRRGTRYPLLVKLYGGVEVSDDVNRFGFAAVGAPVENLQVFASRGYALLLADSKLLPGTPMLDLLKTVLPGVDRAIEIGLADPDRVGIMGHSYGGYSVLALIAQSKRFKAAVLRAGFGDLMAMYGQMAPDGSNYGVPWAETGQGRMGGTPWEIRQRYLENSPIYYLDRVGTPLLIIHGDADQSVSPYLTGEIFVGLRRLGRRVDYVRYGGEGHWEGLWRRQNQVDYLSRVIDWFERYLKDVPSVSR
jgi:dipeptidyl aminopeptidase/acylaminoacyl peptidase